MSACENGLDRWSPDAAFYAPAINAVQALLAKCTVCVAKRVNGEGGGEGGGEEAW